MMAWSRHVLARVRQLELNWSKFKIQAYPLFTMSVIIASGLSPQRETVFFFCMDILFGFTQVERAQVAR